MNASNTRLKQSQLSNLLEYGYSRNRLFMCFNLYFLIACDELYIKKKNHQILNNNGIIQLKNAILFFSSVLQCYLASVLSFSSISLVNVADVSGKINDNELKTLIKRLSSGSVLPPLRCSGPALAITAELPGTSYACWIQEIVCKFCKGELTNSPAMLCYFPSCSEYCWKGVSPGKQHSLGTCTAWGAPVWGPALWTWL